MMITFQRDTPRICLQTVPERIAALLLNGFPCKTEASGGSVESAIAAKVSMIKLIHKSYTAERGDSPKIMPPMKTVARAEMLTVTWNWRNLLTL